MALGIITTALLSGFIVSLIVILVQSAIIWYGTKLLKFKDDTYKSALIVAAILGGTNFVLSLIVLPLKQTPAFFQFLGIAVFAAVLYVTAKLRYDEKVKYTIALVLISLVITIFLNLLASGMISALFEKLALF